MPRSGPEYLRSSAKRSVDLIGGLAVSAAVVPAAIPTAILASIDNRSFPPFFTQERIGFNGAPMTVKKFRSLRMERTQGDPLYYGVYDPRATAIGRMLRRYGLDEIPQLTNVIKGQMSLVGVRAATGDLMDEIEDILPDLYQQWLEAYHSGKPSLISPAQIFNRQSNGSREEVLEAAIRSEINYVKKASFMEDLRIIGTVPVALLLRRAPRQVSELPATKPA